MVLDSLGCLAKWFGRYAFQESDRIPPGTAFPGCRQKPWGTGHALLCAASEVREPFCVVNADDFYGADSYRALAAFLNSLAHPAETRSYAMVGFPLDATLPEHGTVARGLCQTDSAGFLKSIEELTAIERTSTGVSHRETDGRYRPLTGREIVSLNFWGSVPSIFTHLDRLFLAFIQRNGNDPRAEFYIPAAVNDLIQTGAAQVRVLPTRDRWFGITYREDRSHVVEYIRGLVHQGLYPESLWGDEQAPPNNL